MTRPDLDELRRLLADATPGPWKRVASARTDSYIFGPEPGLPIFDRFQDRDGALIAAMRNALPALLREAEAGRKLRERVKCYRCQEDGDEVVCHTCAALADYDREVGT